MSKLVDFFVSGGTDHEGRTLDNILVASDGALEASHDYIQWMFPLHEKSFHSTHAEVLNGDDINVLTTSDVARDNMLKSYNRICKFFGVCDYYDTRKHAQWCYRGNHNLLRATRIIRSLRLFGLP